ncbi:MAG TPA: SurA N-terminal domain-containing protein [bacterium]|nr:SurA N-terminal domain-containing protein [bacterium]MDX9804370.1 SurA N-terminal domain-containing protein [bacterium]HNW15461.1 SurA N-terminal domain-containing protein [bacterium]HOG43116.1 SurA N-terminal domain-containing protein [bacterium]HPG34862.1 SurA N-terminal domain-containing protein [bacterium]
MFQDIRKKSSSILVSLMFAAIIVTFVISFGPGDDAGCSSSAQNYAASVNGELITTSEFRFSYSNMYDYYQRIFRDFNNEMAAQYKLSEKAMDGLIGEILLAQEAKSLGFKVSDEEVRKEIMETPYFQQNGAFDRDSYNKMVQFTLNTTVSDYEHKVRLQLLSRKLRSFLFQSIDISETEVLDEFTSSDEKMDAFVYSILESSLKDEIKNKIKDEISDDEVKTFLEADLTKVKLTFEDNVSKYSKKDGSGQTLFEDVKVDVAKDIMLKDKIAAKMKLDSEAVFTAVKENPSITTEDISKKFPDWNISRKEVPGVVKNAKFVQGVGFSPKFVEKLFGSTEPGVLDSVFITEEGNHVIAGRIKHVPADMEKFEKDKGNIKERLKTTKKAQILENYVDQLRDKATVSINENFLKIYSSPAQAE